MRDTYAKRRSQCNRLSSCFINGSLSIQIAADRHFIPIFFLVLSTFPTGIPKINSKSCLLHFEQLLWHFLFDTTLDRTVRRGGKVLPRRGYEGPEGEQMYSSTLPSTSALDGGGRSAPRPGRFTPGKDPVPIV